MQKKRNFFREYKFLFVCLSVSLIIAGLGAVLSGFDFSLLGFAGLRGDEGEEYEITYFHTNHLGSPVVKTNQQGEVVWSADYEPFGEAFNEVGDNKQKYNSKELDEDTGLYYYGARYYDANTGRFITADTVKGSINDPQSLNRYVYVQNNPMKYIDPSGNQKEEYKAMQKIVLDGMKYYLPEIKELSSQWGVNPKILASVIYAERMQYQLNNLRIIKGHLMEKSKFKGVVNWFLKATGHSRGYSHITYEADVSSKSLALGDSTVVTSKSESLYPDSTRTLYIGEELKNIVESTSSRISELIENEESVNRFNVEDIDVSARILAVLTKMYADEGHDISNNPEILATLYNIGIRNAFPDSSRIPRAGGSTLPIIVDGVYIEDINFGDRAGMIYRSEMMKEFFEE